MNPAVWEISGHIVLKRRKDYDEASEENAWTLLAEVSLSEARFEDFKTMIFKAINWPIAETGSDTSLDDAEAEHSPSRRVDSLKRGSSAMVVPGSHQCVVLQ